MEKLANTFRKVKNKVVSILPAVDLIGETSHAYRRKPIKTLQLTAK